jgi:LEA14-like dessication related protein
MLCLRLLAALCIFALLAGGCSNLQQPTASFRSMKLDNIDANGFTMNFDIELQNPNDVELPLSAADYRLNLGDVEILQGKAKPDGMLPAKGSRNVTLPVSVTYENLLAAEKFIRQSGGNVPFRLDGGLNLGEGLPIVGNSLRVPLKYEGELRLAELLNDPMLLLKSPAARELAQRALGYLTK